MNCYSFPSEKWLKKILNVLISCQRNFCLLTKNIIRVIKFFFRELSILIFLCKLRKYIIGVKEACN